MRYKYDKYAEMFARCVTVEAILQDHDSHHISSKGCSIRINDNNEIISFGKRKCKIIIS